MRIALLEAGPPQVALITHRLEESPLVHATDSSASDCLINPGRLPARQALSENAWHASPELV